MDLSNLVIEAQAGDTDAFGQIYDEFSDKLFRYIRLKCGSAETAEDLLQETFVKAWKGLNGFVAKDGNFSAWMYKIATNTVNDHFRKVYRRPETVELTEGANVAFWSSIENELELESNLAQLQKVLESLPDSYKQILELRYVQDFSLDEVAKILNKTNLSVRVLQHRALNKLKQVIEAGKHINK